MVRTLLFTQCFLWADELRDTSAPDFVDREYRVYYSEEEVRTALMGLHWGMAQDGYLYTLEGRPLGEEGPDREVHCFMENNPEHQQILTVLIQEMILPQGQILVVENNTVKIIDTGDKYGTP